MAYIGINPNQDVATKFTEVFTGDGVTTSFELPVAPGSTFVMDVSVGGVDQIGGINFVINGKNLVFLTGAPPNGTLIKANFAAEIQSGDQSRVKNSRRVQTTIATAGQTVFAVNGGYDPSQIDVYLNGIKLIQTTDFDGTSGSVVTLTSAAADGDEIQTVSYGTFLLADAVQKSGDTMTGPLSVVGTVTATTFSGSLNADDLASGTVPVARLPGQSVLTSGTAVSASGTAVDFTGIPAWVKRITVMFDGVSTNGTSQMIVQLGDAGGIEASGYLSAASIVSTTVSTANGTTGFALNTTSAAAGIYNGLAVLTHVGSNTWTLEGTLGRSDGAALSVFGGSKTLSDTITQLRITTVNGTDTFDAGTINIMYE